MFLKEPVFCRTPRYEVKCADVKDPVKVALTGDWHMSRIVSDKQRQILKEKLEKMKPDVIILQGDLFDTPKSFDDVRLVAKLKKSMKACAKIAPTVMVLGNHDQVEPTHKPPVSHAEYLSRTRKGVVDEWRQLCKDCNVELLIDGWFEVKELRIFGMLQDPEIYYCKPNKKGENVSAMRRHIKELADENVLKFKKGKAHWFVAHAPINELYSMPELSEFDVFSFGHTHGGCVPVLADLIIDTCGLHGGIVAPFLKWFPSRFMRGREKLENGASYVVNTGMVMTQNSAPKLLHYVNFLKSAEITEVIITN